MRQAVQTDSTQKQLFPPISGPRRHRMRRAACVALASIDKVALCALGTHCSHSPLKSKNTRKVNDCHTNSCDVENRALFLTDYNFTCRINNHFFVASSIFLSSPSKKKKQPFWECWTCWA